MSMLNATTTRTLGTTSDEEMARLEALVALTEAANTRAMVAMHYDAAIHPFGHRWCCLRLVRVLRLRGEIATLFDPRCWWMPVRMITLDEVHTAQRV